MQLLYVLLKFAILGSICSCQSVKIICVTGSMADCPFWLFLRVLSSWQINLLKELMLSMGCCSTEVLAFHFLERGLTR